MAARLTTERIKRAFPPLASALRETLREGYRAVDFRHDVLAGLAVGIIAVPLSPATASGRLSRSVSSNRTLEDASTMAAASAPYSAQIGSPFGPRCPSLRCYHCPIMVPQAGFSRLTSRGVLCSNPSIFRIK